MTCDYLTFFNTQLTRPPLFSDADYFVHVDSDCVFKRLELKGGEQKEAPSYRKIRQEDFVDDKGRVRVRRVPFSSLPENHQRWKVATEGMLRGKENVEYETMSCMPIVFPRVAYRLAREAVIENWGENFNLTSFKTLQDKFFEIISSLDDFGEFTILGHVLTTRLKKGDWWLPDAAEFESAGEEEKRSMCVAEQAWSWGGMTPEAAIEIEMALRLGW